MGIAKIMRLARMRPGLLVAAAVAVAPSLALGETARADEPPGASAFKRFDLDGDEFISFEEFERAGEDRIKGMDADGDGAVSQAEFLAFHEKQAKARIDRWFATLDKNKNGKLEAAELKGEQAQRLLRCDANKDGVLTRDELTQCQRRIAEIWMKRIFANYDKNGDGLIDRAERQAPLRERFKKLDANGDGRISRDEFATAYQRWSERRNAPGGAPSGRAASPPSELDELE